MNLSLPVEGLSADAFVEHAVDRKSTRLNSSHGYISYAVFCLKKKNKELQTNPSPLNASLDIAAAAVDYHYAIIHSSQLSPICTPPHFNSTFCKENQPKACTSD